MIGTIDIEVQAKNPNMPLWPLRAYVNSPSSLRVRNVPKKIGKWEITAVQVRVVYPDITDKTAQCVLVGGVWVGTVEGSTAVGSFKNGYTVLADGVDENGNPVTGYVLGRGDVEILKVDGTPISGDVSYFVTDEELAEGLSVKADLSALGDYIPYTVDKNGSKTAVTVGTRTSEELVGQYSMSIGVLNTLTRSNTLAVGFQNILSNDNSFAVGQNNTVGGTISFAVGYNNKVQMSKSVAIGDTNTLSAESTQAIGTQNQVGGKYGIALGVKCRANDSGSFVWNGSDKNFASQFPLYYSHGKGTFNVNPVSGAAGFYIGETSLADILSAKADLSALDYKRDLTDMKVKGVPENDNSASWFTIKYGTTTENAWYYDEGRWETGQTLRVLAAPAAIFSLQKQIEGQWTSLGEFQLDSNSEAAITYEGVTYSITGYIGDLVVSNELNTRLAALEARIAALEGN